ncbi:hypothetical protein MTP99_018648 [Tenebrio molitor]|nr:hypothetical protein MTP99_018648 [Tenebrio molitor]
MVDFKLVLNPPIIGKKSVLVQRKCRRRNGKVSNARSSSDDASRRDETPRVKKRCLIFAIILVIICASIGFAYHYGLFSKDKEDEELRPPNPVKALQSSPSSLHRFKKAAVCADGAACAEIGK